MDGNAQDILIAKRQIVADLKLMLEMRFKWSDAIEHKAIELFKFSSAIVAIIAGLGLTVSEIRDEPSLVIGFILLFIVYLIHITCLYRVMRPGVYSTVPGIPHLATTYDDFYASYIGKGEDGYLVQMISDLGGTDDAPGAIEKNEKRNAEKAKFLNYMGLTFVVMNLDLLIMATIVFI